MTLPYALHVCPAYMARRSLSTAQADRPHPRGRAFAYRSRPSRRNQAFGRNTPCGRLYPVPVGSVNRVFPPVASGPTVPVAAGGQASNSSRIPATISTIPAISVRVDRSPKNRVEAMKVNTSSIWPTART